MILHLPVSPIYDKNFIAITLQTSNFFAPYASVTIQSILEHAADDFCYDIIVMTWDMKAETAEKLTAMANGRRNISIRVVDVSNEIESYVAIAKKRSDYERFSATGVIRLLLPELLTEFDKILNLDCDMVLCADAAELDAYDLSEYYMGGVPDTICYVLNRRSGEKQFTDELLFEKLKLDSAADYVNAGLLLLNLKNIRRDFSTDEIMEFAQNDGTFFTCYEQDTFNGLFRKKKLKLPAEWNWIIDTYCLMSNGAFAYPINDPFLKKYTSAGKNPKNIHYVGQIKPWSTAKCPCSKEWWCAARNSPFFERIFSGMNEMTAKSVSNSNFWGTYYGQSHDSRLLFLAESDYQLITALNIKFHYYKNYQADIILCGPDSFKRKENRLLKTGLFTDVILSDYVEAKDNKILLKMQVKERMHYPNRYEKLVKLNKEYSDYFMPRPHSAYQKMLYYSMIKAKKNVKVHVFEDGPNSYTDNIDWALDLNMNHSLYPESKRIRNNIMNFFIYKPELYCGNSELTQILIPEISNEDTEFHNVLHMVYGECASYTEKYVFLNENFAEEGQLSDEIMLLEEISKIVGKDNILIKLHPESKEIGKLLRLNKFHIFEDQSYPFELCAKNKGTEDKVLLSVSSRTLMEPYILCGKIPYTITLMDTMKLSGRWYIDSPGYRDYMERSRKSLNKQETRFFHPFSIRELKNVLKFIEGEAP